MINVFSAKKRVVLSLFLTLGIPLISGRCLAESESPYYSPAQFTENQVPSSTNQSFQWQPAINQDQLNSVFIPPPRSSQQSSTYVNYRYTTTPAPERGDRPQLREIMRLTPAVLPYFVTEN
ncbi:hypothetical protein Lepto7376_4098 [[Leptolyngbya] sp. PCC 7376]|uniref:hypothetical protein n=1 Tax=[Leptolyngbya] sp. PCC 7376 TaxID=111781 RepID=UPI00029F32B5|nr:hypothetical protein [[Leptolyngbya] sp. PCC 7376]AFY40227.1 hypothetical protein Lepto7376_4098 [[Leptolyngbya] sp. PCC 7376]